MTPLQTILSIWALVAIASILFIRGAHRKPIPPEIRRVRELEKA
jgi:hypothetical protein